MTFRLQLAMSMGLFSSKDQSSEITHSLTPQFRVRKSNSRTYGLQGDDRSIVPGHWGR